MLPKGGVIEQSDATSWMGMYCLNMMTIALELSRGESRLRRRGFEVSGTLCLYFTGDE